VSALVANERIKLLASLLNTAAMAVFGAGAIIPVINYAYDNVPQNSHPEKIPPMVGVCTVLAVLLHLSARWYLGGLDDDK
jgi:hypothetical protein